jgi:copper transport protein
VIRKCGAVAAIAVVVLVSTPLRVGAHAELLDSQPPAQARLGLAPASLVLAFSEPLSPSLSEATATDPSGRAVTAHPASATEIRVPMLTNLPGVYLVTWKAISATDGHATHGSYTFTVEARVSVAGGIAASGPTPLDVLIATGRWIEDGSLLLGAGMVLIGWLARRRRPIEWVHPPLLPPLVAALAAGAVVVAGEAIAAGVTLGGAPAYFASPDGAARIGRVLLEVLACGAVLTRVRPALFLALPLALGALSASGHATGMHPPWLGVALDLGHLLAAGVWLGGIMALATLRPPDGWRASGRELLARFTPWALAGFAASVGLGAVQAVADVGGLPALVSTAYGRVLIAKAAAVAAIIPLSVLAWRHRRTHLRIEAAIGAVVVGAAALLASFPVPARTDAAPASALTAHDAGLPRGNELTLGAEAGQSLVGLTIDPAAPGPNIVTIYVNAGDGGVAARTLAVAAMIGGRSVALHTCGATCRSAGVRLVGGDRVAISVSGAQGGIARFQLPPLPAPDASGLVAAARTRMSGLHSVTLHETLTGGAGTTITTDYQEGAPNLLQWSQPDGSATIVVGTARYTRTHPHDPWTLEPGNPAIAEPAFSWGLFAPDVAAHVMGTVQIAGVTTTAIAFFAGAPETPVWFRFYVDARGLVRRADMSAPGHFMVQTFAGFDVPLRITRPDA